MNKTKKLTTASMLVAIGIIASNLVYIPVGVSKCYPIQHGINVIAAVLLGPYYAVAVAFSISLMRNILGTGSLLAFPGSMIGALLAGLLFKKTNKNICALAGEIFGTGFLGALISYPIAKFIMGKDVAALFFVAPFMISTIGGSIIAYLLLNATAFARTLKKVNN